MSNPPKPWLVYLTTHSIAAGRLLIGQLAYFRERGYEVVAVASPPFKKLWEAVDKSISQAPRVNRSPPPSWD